MAYRRLPGAKFWAFRKKEAAQFISAYFARYRGVKEYLDNSLAETRKTEMAKTLFGRIRPDLGDHIHRRFKLRQFCRAHRLNSPLQGTASRFDQAGDDRLSTGAWRKRKLDAKMILQVHDELLFEAPEKEQEALTELVRDEMENVHKLAVPLVVEIGVGTNWRDLSKRRS